MGKTAGPSHKAGQLQPGEEIPEGREQESPGAVGLGTGVQGEGNTSKEDTGSVALDELKSVQQD